MSKGYAVLIPFSTVENAKSCAERIGYATSERIGYATYIVCYKRETKMKVVFVAEEVE